MTRLDRSFAIVSSLPWSSVEETLFTVVRLTEGRFTVESLSSLSSLAAAVSLASPRRRRLAPRRP
jgi:hypothetical protein